jgi:hypothetical protein
MLARIKEAEDRRDKMQDQLTGSPKGEGGTATAGSGAVGQYMDPTPTNIAPVLGLVEQIAAMKASVGGNAPDTDAMVAALANAVAAAVATPADAADPFYEASYEMADANVASMMRAVADAVAASDPGGGGGGAQPPAESPYGVAYNMNQGADPNSANIAALEAQLSLNNMGMGSMAPPRDYNLHHRPSVGDVEDDSYFDIQPGRSARGSVASATSPQEFAEGFSYINGHDSEEDDDAFGFDGN